MQRFLLIIATLFNGAIALFIILLLKKRFSGSFDPLLDTSFFHNPGVLISGIVLFLIAAIGPHFYYKKGRIRLANLIAFGPVVALIALVALILVADF